MTDQLDQETPALTSIVPAVPAVPTSGEDGKAGDDGAAVLDAVETYAGRFIAFPSEAARVAFALWVAHAHAVDAFVYTPRIAFLSPERGSGKSRALEIAALLVPRPMFTVSISPAALYRSLLNEDTRPTLLLDETDAIFRPNSPLHEELRALLNTGHHKGATVQRVLMKGQQGTVVEYPTYSAVALAGLGALPETISSRSIIIRMQRRAPDEHVEQFRLRRHQPQGKSLNDRLSAWVVSIYRDLSNSDIYPEMPPGVTDRPADVWEPLLAIADIAGGDWPKRSRDACVFLTKTDQDDEVSEGVQLLGEIREVFKEQSNPDSIFTSELIDELFKRESGNFRIIEPNMLARLLKPYGVRSVRIRTGGTNLRGYQFRDFEEPWRRYLSRHTD